MTYLQLIKYFGGDYKNAAFALGFPPTTVHSWRTRGIPIGRQHEIRELTGGALSVAKRKARR